MTATTSRLHKIREKIATSVLALLGAHLTSIPDPPMLSDPPQHVMPNLHGSAFSLDLDTAHRAIAENPQSAGLEAYAVRAAHRIGQGDFEGAIHDLNDALSTIGPELPRGMLSRAHSIRALAYLSLRLDGEAAHDCDMAINFDAANPEAYQLRGTLRAETRDLHGAEADFTAYYRLMPYSARAISNFAWVRLLRKDTDVAVRMAQDALDRDPTDAVAHYTLGRVHAAQKRRAEAMAAYQIALAHWPNPNSPQALPHTDLMRAYIARWEPSHEGDSITMQ